VPLVVVAELGTAATAYFFTAWLVATTLDLLANGMTGSFVAEAAGDRANIARYKPRDPALHGAPHHPGGCDPGPGAPFILALFGRGVWRRGDRASALAVFGQPLRDLQQLVPCVLTSHWPHQARGRAAMR